VIANRWTVEKVLQQRLFPWQADLSGWLAECYFARIPTRRLAKCRQHDLSYAR
jgi:hypothetical protein